MSIGVTGCAISSSACLASAIWSILGESCICADPKPLLYMVRLSCVSTTSGLPLSSSFLADVPFVPPEQGQARMIYPHRHGNGCIQIHTEQKIM